MFYRRKVLLTLLQLFDNELGKIRLQKLLFLFTQGQTKKEYDFIPYFLNLGAGLLCLILTDLKPRVSRPALCGIAI